jgi:hypothetical protein
MLFSLVRGLAQGRFPQGSSDVRFLLEDPLSATSADGAEIGSTAIGAGVGDCSVLRTDTVSMVGRALAPFPPALGLGLREIRPTHVDGGHNKALCHCVKRPRLGTTPAREVLTLRAKWRSLASGPAWQTKPSRRVAADDVNASFKGSVPSCRASPRRHQRPTHSRRAATLSM